MPDAGSQSKGRVFDKTVVTLFAVGLVMFVMLPWSLSTAVQFSTRLFRAIPALVS